MTVAALPPPTRFEILQSHAETGRSNLVCWDLTEPEARRVLSELEDNQRARQGAVMVSGRSESGWVYVAREQGSARVLRPTGKALRHG